MTIAPLRVTGSTFSRTRYATVPFPLPSLPAVISIHGDCGLAVHAHSRSVLTFTELVPPPGPKLDVGVVKVTAQRAGVAEGPATLVTFVVANLRRAAGTGPATKTKGRGTRRSTSHRHAFRPLLKRV